MALIPVYSTPDGLVSAWVIHFAEDVITANHTCCFSTDIPMLGITRLYFETKLLKRDKFRVLLDTVSPGRYAFAKTAET